MPDVCSRCERPVIEDSNGNWVHAEVADAVFCDLVMRAPERIGRTCKHCPGRLIMVCPDDDDCELGGWIHVDDDSHVCNAQSRTVAEPEPSG